MLKQINRKSLVFLGLIIAIFLLALSLIYFFSQRPKQKEEKFLPTEKTLKEVIEDLTAPVEEKEIPPVPEEVIKELSAPKAPKQNYQVPAEIIKNLTSPE